MWLAVLPPCDAPSLCESLDRFESEDCPLVLVVVLSLVVECPREGDDEDERALSALVDGCEGLREGVG